MSDLILIGNITGPHGLKGEVKVKFYTDNLSDIRNYTFYDSEKKVINFSKISQHKGDIFICRMQGVEDRNQSELLKGEKIFVFRDDLPSTESNEFYVHDLINMEVMSLQKNKIGSITNVMDYGAGAIIEITDLDNKKSYTRFNDSNFPEVDLKKNFVIFDK